MAIGSRGNSSYHCAGINVKASGKPTAEAKQQISPVKSRASGSGGTAAKRGASPAVGKKPTQAPRLLTAVSSNEEDLLRSSHSDLQQGATQDTLDLSTEAILRSSLEQVPALWSQLDIFCIKDNLILMSASFVTSGFKKYLH